MQTQVAVDTQIMRGINASAVLAVLRTESRMSVSDLSERTGLSRQAVTRALASLDGAGLVMFSPPDTAEPRSGRPAQLVRFRAEAGLVLGASVTPREVRVALADLSGRLVSSSTVAIDPDSPVGSIIDGIRAALAVANATSQDVWSASVGSPGIIDPELGLVRFVPSMSSLQGDVLARAVGDELQCPVELDNDLNLATEGELWRGGLTDVSSMVLIEWGERVGGGLVLNGTLYRGASNDAGDIGFLPVIAQGEDLPSGDPAQPLGAFESWVGARALVAEARRVASPTLAAALDECDDTGGLDVVVGALHAGDETALEAITVVGERFAVGLATIRALLDPQLVIIGGPMARGGEHLLHVVRAALDRSVLNPPAIAFSALGDDAIVYGAIHRALAHVEATHFASHTVTDRVTPHSQAITK